MLSDFSKYSGLAGASLIILAIVISALRYRGRQGERYALLNHFISELGEVGVSGAARVFNGGLMVGGLLLLPFMIGLGVAFQSLWGWLGALSGVIASLGVAAVGRYPMNRLNAHVRAAMIYFRAGLAMVVCFGLAILFQPGRVLPPAANLLSLAAALCYGAFLARLDRPAKRLNVSGQNAASAFDPRAMTERPRLWLTPLLEWLVFFSTVAWIFGVAVLG